MNLHEALAHYGSQAAIARACEISDAAVHQWFKQGFIPYPRQCELQIESGNKVIARKEDGRPAPDTTADLALGCAGDDQVTGAVLIERVGSGGT